MEAVQITESPATIKTLNEPDKFICLAPDTGETVANLETQLPCDSEERNKASPAATPEGMLHVISQLSNSQTHDDRYFMEKLDDLVESIRQWARLFSSGQPPLTLEDLRSTKVTWQVWKYLRSAFLDIRSLLNAKSIGGKIRTRFVEAILLGELMGDRLWKRHIGFLESNYESHTKLIQQMNQSTGKLHYSNYYII